MIAKGSWKGQYKYDNKAHQKLKGVAGTNFVIDIVPTTDEYFTGTVQDDLETGGTEGVGQITGRVTGNKIEFVKQMPVMTMLLAKKGMRKTFNRKHRKIYYTGTFSDDRKTVSGQWKFKFGFIRIWIMPVPVMPSSGTWTMTLAG
jgi:hypothetical protein